jgi:glycosyltransferase involved in cell wall biosynthesis
MPLLDKPYQRGKSGYKLIQCMACAVPAVGSPVGVNNSILTAECGILAHTFEEWAASPTRLLEDGKLRWKLGAAGRSRAVEHYSLAVHAPRLVELFLQVAKDKPAAAGAGVSAEM